MPIMTRMRDSMPTILFGLLIAFLITLVFDWGMDYMGIRSSGSDTIGTVNGKKISYHEFSDLLRDYTENQRTQTGNELSDEQLRTARDQVWQSLVNRELLAEQMQKMNIIVTDQELRDWVRGDNPPDDLRRNFIDSTGQFRRDVYNKFLDDPNQFVKDPQGNDLKFGTKWLVNYEQYLRERRRQEKLQSLVTASVLVSEGEIRQKFSDQNVNYEFLYALFDINRLIPDSMVTVTDDDLRRYYNDHLDQQKVGASRTIKFVHLREVPSSDDTADVRGLMESLADRARGGEDFLSLVFTYDEKPDSGTYFNHGEMTPGLEDAAFSARRGEIVGPILGSDGYHLLKVLDEKKGEKEYVHAAHVLFQVSAGADSGEALASARNVAAMARNGKDFGELAKEYSKDPGSAQHGGDLGWFTRDRMVKPFADAAFRARPGEVVGPVRSQFGWHVIKVFGKEARQIKVADIHLQINPSSQTKNELYDRAVDFAYNARRSDFTKEAQAVGFEPREAKLQEKGSVIPGLGVSVEAVAWCFDSGVGDVSEPFNVANGYAVFVVVETTDPGIRPFDEAKESLRLPTMREMKLEKLTVMAEEERSRLSPEDDLNRITEFNSEVRVQKAGPMTLVTAIPGIGRENNIIGTVEGLQVGQISHAVRSPRGVFLIQLISRGEFDSTAYAGQREALLTQMLKERRTRFFNDWMASLKEGADIEDNRATFYR